MSMKPTYEELEKRVRELEMKTKGVPERDPGSSGNYFKRLVETAGDVIYTVNDRGIFTYVSPNSEAVVGYKSSYIIGRSFLPFLHKDDRKQVADAIREIVKNYRASGGRNIPQRLAEFRVRHRKGKWKWMAARNAILDVRDDHFELVCIARDIGEQKKYEAALRKSEEKYRFLIEESNDIIWTFDLSTMRFSFASNSVERVLGYPTPGWSHFTVDSVFSPETKKHVFSEFIKLRKGETSSNQILLEAEHKCSDGSNVWMEINAVMHKDSQGRPLSFTGISRDISKRKQAEEEEKKRSMLLQKLALELSNAEERERKRVALVLHDDLQQYLAAFHFNLHTLPLSVGNKALNERVEHLDGLIDESIRKCRVLSYDLSPPILHQHGFLAALGWLATDFEKKYGLKVNLQTDREAEPPSPALSSMLYRSVRELLFNAAKHSGADSVLVQAYEEDGNICISVKDKGKGCDPEAVEKKKEMAGFGLFTIEERIKFLDGGFHVETAPGKGCTVSLCMPISAE